MSKESRRAARTARETSSRPGSSGPTGGARAGRRERARRYNQPTFFEKYRSWFVGVAVVGIAVLAAGFIVLGATTKAYACTTEWVPAATPSPAPDATPRLGYIQDSMGNQHNPQLPARYTFCPPASGSHYGSTPLGPVQPRVFGPEDSVSPVNWIHNLEHGALVVLYRGDSPGATPEGLETFRDFFDTLPESPICKLDPGQISPVIARFDEMAYPYAALVWGRVLPLEEWDPELVRQFYLTESERLDANGVKVAPPELQCLAPSPFPSASPSASASAPASASPSAASPSASAAASASPSPS